jgi:uncharacterized protein YegJ (DUF2314 family)
VNKQLCLAAIAGFALAGCSGGEDRGRNALQVAPADNPRFSGEKDVDMRMAAHKAQVSLDEFDERLTHPPSGQTRIGLRGIFASQGQTEYLWLRNVTIVPEGYRGMITSPPTLPGFALDQEVALPRDAVADWYAVEGGYLIAGYSLRLMRSRLSAEERARADAKSGYIIEE